MRARAFSADASERQPPLHTVNRTKLIALLIALAIFVLCLALFWTTQDAMEHLPFLKRTSAGQHSASHNTLVDLRPWLTASALAPLAVSNEEAQYASDAERLADHEVDQAFATALRQATEKIQHTVLTGSALALAQRVSQLEELVKEDREQVDQDSPSAANPEKANNGKPIQETGDDLDIAKAQLGLDTDQLSNAQDDLARASGDNRAQIQSELQEHEASMKSYDRGVATHQQPAVVSATSHHTLAALVGAWTRQRSRHALLQQAQQQALADAAALTVERNALRSRADDSSRAAVRTGNGDHATRLEAIRERSAQRQLLGIFNDRIQTQEQLAEVYGKWANQVLLQRRIVVHLILGSLSLIAFIVTAVLLLDALTARLIPRSFLSRGQVHTLRTLFQLLFQIVGIVLIVLVIFGPPRQMATIIGLVTAGMTVVLQDFILAFFGWFVLMGRHGMHVGDWVEINGVGGEVTEIGLFRTSLLETGNWTDSGHPTGRRGTFMNSFAIRGQYFNFSTTGQWLWDEFSVSVAAGEDTYALVESIHKAVIAVTEKDALQAEQEWKRGSHSEKLGRFRAEATVNLRPSSAGVDVVLRYVTRASDRAQVRDELFQKVLDVLHKRSA